MVIMAICRKDPDSASLSGSRRRQNRLSLVMRGASNISTHPAVSPSNRSCKCYKEENSTKSVPKEDKSGEKREKEEKRKGKERHNKCQNFSVHQEGEKDINLRQTIKQEAEERISKLIKGSNQLCIIKAEEKIFCDEQTFSQFQDFSSEQRETSEKFCSLLIQITAAFSSSIHENAVKQ